MTITTEVTRTAQKILIIEDEGEMGLVLNLLLDDEDVELEYVQNLEAAAEYLAIRQPSLVILDNKLPDGYGVDFISFIKRKYPSVKVIMITGFDSSVCDVAMENGADSFLEKPFTRKQIFESIQSVLRRPLL
jgi:two-component system, OmpR family, response regulator